MHSLLRAMRTNWRTPAQRRGILRGTWSLAVVLAAGWLIVMPGVGKGAAASAGGVARVGREAPDFTVKTLGTAAFSLREARGKPVWINFWASWCPPCRAEIPDIEATRGDAGDRMQFIAVNLREPESAIASYFANTGYDFPVGVDPEGEVSSRFRVLGLPTHVFIAADGTVAAIRVGGMTRSDMRETVSALLAGQTPPPPGQSGTALEPADVKLGAALYNAQCLACHGARDGSGRLPDAPSHANDGHTWHHPDLQLTEVIMRGSGTPRTMPAFEDKLRPGEVRAILSYIKTWWGAEQRAYQAQVTKESDRGRSR